MQICKYLNLIDWDPLNGILANSEDSNEMPHNVAFHQGLHCLQGKNRASEKEMYRFRTL